VFVLCLLRISIVFVLFNGPLWSDLNKDDDDDDDDDEMQDRKMQDWKMTDTLLKDS